MPKLLPTPLQQAAYLQAFDDLVAGRFDALPLEEVLVYLVDMVNATALPFLAAQFDILGNKGYIYATTEAEKRDTIRNAIELHRYKGTPWAIKEALSKIGLVVNSIEEGVGGFIYYNGSYTYDGTRTYGSDGHWANFRVYLQLTPSTVISATQIADAVAIINEYKNVRSHLYDITVQATAISDTLNIADSVAVEAQSSLVDTFGGFYDGTYTYDGTLTYQNIADEINAAIQAIDADALAFIIAASITNQTQQDAINDLISELKLQGLWAKMQAIYPMVGGTSASHKLNAKNPADTNAAFRLSFVGGWSHTSTGATPNGTNAYANTFYTPSTHGVAASQHISYYSRSNAAGSYIEMGVTGSASSAGEGQLCIAPNLGGTAYRAVNTTGNAATVTTVNAAAYFIASRTDATFYRMHRNGVQIFNDAALPNTLSNKPLYLGARNNNGTANGFSARECGFASIGEGLTAAEAVTLNTIVQSYLTTLGR